MKLRQSTPHKPITILGCPIYLSEEGLQHLKDFLRHQCESDIAYLAIDKDKELFVYDTLPTLGDPDIPSTQTPSCWYTEEGCEFIETLNIDWESKDEHSKTLIEIEKEGFL
ncbi:hypothetical protein [Vibrio phage RYC]|nr:hypothetical protein [Vibrio phage RYC]